MLKAALWPVSTLVARLPVGLLLAALAGVVASQEPTSATSDGQDAYVGNAYVWGEDDALHGWLDRLRDRWDMRLAVDVSYRGIFSDASDELAGVGAVGLDIYKVFGSARGDWGTLTLQPYLTRIDNLAMHPPFFESDDDWELVWRIANFNYTGLSDGRFNVRVGHFEIPYGLEQVINTNGTLRDYTHGRNLGVKADWGVTVNGELQAAEYEVAISRGTGNEYTSRGGPLALAGRIGTDRDEDLVLGLSAFHGEIDNPGAVGAWLSGFNDPMTAPNVGRIIRRTRVGVDAQYRAAWVDLLCEGSYGRDYDQDVANFLGEIDWTSPTESYLLYTQTRVFLQEFDSGWVDDVSLVLGARYSLDAHASLSCQLQQGLTNFANQPRDTTAVLQLRYRF